MHWLSFRFGKQKVTVCKQNSEFRSECQHNADHGRCVNVKKCLTLIKCSDELFSCLPCLQQMTDMSIHQFCLSVCSVTLKPRWAPSPVSKEKWNPAPLVVIWRADCTQGARGRSTKRRILAKLLSVRDYIGTICLNNNPAETSIRCCALFTLICPARFFFRRFSVGTSGQLLKTQQAWSTPPKCEGGVGMRKIWVQWPENAKENYNGKLLTSK